MLKHIGDTVPPMKIAALSIMCFVLAACSQSNPPGLLSIPGNCPTDVAQDASSIINSQITAFGQGDFEKARTLSSRRFRFFVPTESFARIMKEDYAILLNNPKVKFVDCDIPSSTQLVIKISVADEQILTYTLVNEDGNWRIDVAGFTQDDTIQNSGIKSA
jgi:hypothetical protein